MSRALVKLSKEKRSKIKPPAGLEQLFDDPPLAANEKREDYDNFFSAVAAAVNPGDAIAWLFTRDISDLSWEIRRERRLKLQVIKSAEEDIVRKLLMPPSKPLPFTGELLSLSDAFLVDPEAENEAKRWASDPKARRRIDRELTEKGYDASYISTAALNQKADDIDAIDRRIASYELRRMAALRAIEHYSERLARRLDAASDVIEGQFTEAAE